MIQTHHHHVGIIHQALLEKVIEEEEDIRILSSAFMLTILEWAKEVDQKEKTESSINFDDINRQLDDIPSSDNEYTYGENKNMKDYKQKFIN